MTEYITAPDGTRTVKGGDDKARRICSDARKFLDEATQYEAKNRRDGLDDLHMVNGEHWSAQAKADRGVGTPDERPTITINPFKTFGHQITNDQRQNRPSIDVSPVGDGGDVKVAEIYRGMIRAIQRNSDADIAIDTAMQGAVYNGWGWLRIGTEYESDKSFDQTLVFRRIRNCMSVYSDPDAQDPTTKDKRRCLVVESMHKDVFKARYQNASPLNWDAGIYQATPFAQPWFSDNHITVAEYWVVETESRQLVRLSDGFVGYRDDLAPEAKERIASGVLTIDDKRDVECKTVKCYKLTAHEVLEEYEWLDEIIPILRVVGDETDINGEVTLSGIVRDAKDAARMYDYWVSSETEAVALIPKAPYIMEEGQTEGHEHMWRTANKKAWPFLTYKATSVAGKPAPPPQRNPFGGPPAAIIAAKEGAAQDLFRTTGVRFDASKQERTQDESGIALAHLRQNTDLGAYHYHDGVKRVLKVAGEILVRMIPKIYNRTRIVTIVRENDTEEHVQLDPFQEEAVDYATDKRGKKIRSFNPNIGKYAVAVGIGPNYATKRQAQSAGMLEFMKTLPNVAPLIADQVAKVQDWEGAEEISRRLAMTLPPGMLQSETLDMTPEAEALLGQMQQQIQKLTQEREQLLGALTEKVSDQAIEKQKNDQTHEAAMAKIEADLLTKLGGMMQEREQAFLDRLHEHFMQVSAAELQPAPAATQ